MAFNDIVSGFRVQSSDPIDSRLVCADLVSRDAIPALARYEGLQTYVISEKEIYVLQEGIEDTNWVDITSAISEEFITEYETKEQLVTKLGDAYLSPGDIQTLSDRANEHSQGYIGLLSDFYFGGDSTQTVIDDSNVGTFVDVILDVNELGVFDNRPTDMKEDSLGYSGDGSNGSPFIFSLEGLDTTSFASFRVSMDFTPEVDEGQLESRILFDRHSGTSPSNQFSIEEVSLSMQQGADIPYTAEPLLSFFVGDSIDTNAPGDAGKVRFQIRSDVEGVLRTRGLTLYVNK